MKRTLILILISALALALCACGGAKPSPAAAQGASGSPVPAAEDAQSSAAAASTDSPNAWASALSGANVEPLKAWPADELPAVVPAFTYGTFVTEKSGKAVVNDVPTYEMVFSGVKKDDVNAYGATITGNGFVCTPAESNGNYALACVFTNKDGTSTVMGVQLKNDGTCIVSATLNVKTAN